MDGVSASLLLLLLCCVLLAWMRRSRAHGRALLPPGPRPLPVLGNFLQLDQKNLLQSLMKMSEEFGPVFTVYLGLRPVVVLSGFRAVREALVGQAEDFSGRGQLPCFSTEFREHGVVFSNGERWRVLRRFSLSTLRDFGMGKRSIEERVQEEAQCLVQELRRTQGVPFNPVTILGQAVANVICSVVFGDRFDYRDAAFLRLYQVMRQRILCASSAPAMLYNIFPEILGRIPGPHHRGYKHSQEIIAFIRERVKMQQESLDPSAPQNYIDCFLAKIEQEKQKPGSEFNLENLVMSTFNLFFAGTETITTTLRYAFLILLKYPQLQERLREEIDRVVGRGQLPAVRDRQRMPYTEAVLHEVQRFADILPMSLPHAVTQDTLFRGYVIPKGTCVYPLLSSVHSDPEHHPSPQTFSPERFLDADGCLKKQEAFMPFSAGKRACLGEGLARTELFLFFTAVLQTFTLSSPTPPGKVCLEPIASNLAKLPPDFQLSLVPR